MTHIAANLSEAHEPFRDLRCSGGKLYLGSMFYLDFGNYFTSRTRHGARIDIGEMTLSVRDVAWHLHEDVRLRCDATDVVATQFSEVVEELRGKTITAFKQPDRRSIVIELGSRFRLSIDLTNSFDSDSDVLVLALPDGRRFAVDEQGRFVYRPSDAERLARWRVDPRQQ